MNIRIIYNDLRWSIEGVTTCTFIYILIVADGKTIESLHYTGFAFAYLEDDVQFTSTFTATCCATPQILEYIRSVIVACVIECN